MNASLAIESDVAAIAGGYHGDPFAVLGMHAQRGGCVVRAFLPQAARVRVVERESGRAVATLRRVHGDGFFAAAVRRLPFPYELRIVRHDGTQEQFEDPYRFGPVLGELDVHLLAEGTHDKLYDVLGAHERLLDGVRGFVFAVWAPNARRVSVVGEPNAWDGRRHPMRLRTEAGVWEIFLPGVNAGERYKFEIRGSEGTLLPLKADPLARSMERPPANESVLSAYRARNWSDDAWLSRRHAANDRAAPIAIYEVHLGSWRRGPANRYLTYAELGEQLVSYVAELGFTHIELMPINEYPFDGSWGYQGLGLFAPTSRFGTPAEFAALVDRIHAAGLGLILDWVPGHFPSDEHGLALFDGTHLYEHSDPRQGFQPDWNTLIDNFGRREVSNFLLNNARFWFDEYHVDGLRVDAVASMLYLDYSRKEGAWVPNEFGGNENLAAIAFLRRVNETAYGEHPGIATIAEESTAWPKVSAPVYVGGLGFGYKWNMGWMHDTLAYLSEDPINRKYHHNKMTFGLLYAFSENFVLPLSHDEVVHGKGSLISKMPGDGWQRFANLRAYLGFMWGHPGKKLLFMGSEFAQEREWNHDQSLDWHLLDQPRHAGMQRLVAELNHLYRATPALHALDYDAAGFEWIDADNRDASVYTFIRKGSEPGDFVIVACNFTPVVRYGFRLCVPAAGTYREALNSDADRFGGSNVLNEGELFSEPFESGDFAAALTVTLPPLATIVIVPVRLH